MIRAAVALAFAFALTGGAAAASDTATDARARATADVPVMSVVPTSTSETERSIISRFLRDAPSTGERTAQMCPYGVAYLCLTQFGACQLAAPLCVGQPCYCPTYQGPIWGTAGN